MRHMNIRLIWARGMPFLFCLFLILLNQIPFHFLPNYPYAIQWVYIPIFYFAVYNPSVLSSWAVFILGLMAELLTQSPCGVTTFSYVLVFFVANYLRKYLVDFTFVPLWGIFCVSILIIELFTYCFICILAGYFVVFMPVFVEAVILMLFYPFLMRFCGHLDRKAREVV